MIYCVKCGAALDDDARFCYSCGARQPDGTQPQQGPAAWQQPAQNQWQQPGNAQQAGQPPQGWVQPQSGWQPPQQGYGGGAPYGAMPGGQPPKKKSKGPVIAIAAAALALVVCGVLLYVNLRPGNEGETVSSGVAEKAPAKSAARSNPAPEASSVPQEEPEGEGFAWVQQPSVTYDELTPISNYQWANEGEKYALFRTGEGYGLVDLATGEEYLAGNETPLFFCDEGYLHGLPEEMSAPEELEDMGNARLQELGLPFRTHGGHGGYDSMVWGYNPATGEMTLGFVGYGEFYTMGEEYPIEPEYIPEVLRVLDVTATDEMGFLPDDLQWGLADKNGNLLLPLAYDEVGPVVNDICRVSQNGLYGYYHATRREVVSECIYEPLWTDEWGMREAGHFSGEYCAVMQNGKAGFIDAFGALVVPCRLDSVTQVYGGNRAWALQDGQWGVIEITG